MEDDISPVSSVSGHLSDQDAGTFLPEDGLSLSRKHMFSSPSDELLTIRPSSHDNNSRVQELTINKLRYGDVKFVGRKVESEILQSRLNRMMMTATDDGSNEVEASGSQK